MSRAGKTNKEKGALLTTQRDEALAFSSRPTWHQITTSPDLAHHGPGCMVTPATPLIRERKSKMVKRPLTRPGARAHLAPDSRLSWCFASSCIAPSQCCRMLLRASRSVLTEELPAPLDLPAVCEHQDPKRPATHRIIGRLRFAAIRGGFKREDRPVRSRLRYKTPRNQTRRACCRAASARPSPSRRPRRWPAQDGPMPPPPPPTRQTGGPS